MKLIYIDTNIIMDFLKNRNSSSYNLFMSAMQCNYSLLLSDVVIRELKYQGLETEVGNFIHLFNNKKKIQIYTTTYKDRIKAKHLVQNYPTHLNDALHKIAASHYPIDYFVTRNKKDFLCFKDLDLKLPEELE